MEKNSLGCGGRFNKIPRGSDPTIPIMNTTGHFICGVEDGWGKEYLCDECQIKLRQKWNEEDQKQPRAEEIAMLKSIGK